MNYINYYSSPLGKIILTSDGEYLTGLYFASTKDEKNHQGEYQEIEIFLETKKWLDIYFQGEIPTFTPKYKLNLTPFRKQVTEIINKIPYGELTTYNDIAKEIAKTKNIKKMSAQAVGGAVSANPICIIIPCHRVIGQNNNLVGYLGGLKNKIALLQIEKHDITKFKVAKNAKM